MGGAISKSPGDATFEVLADHDADQFKAFKLNTSGQAILATAQGELARYTLQDDPGSSGEGGHFTYSGISKILLGGTVAADDKLTTGTDGRYEIAAGGDEVLGTALQAGVAGEIIDGTMGAMGIV